MWVLASCCGSFTIIWMDFPIFTCKDIYFQSYISLPNMQLKIPIEPERSDTLHLKFVGWFMHVSWLQFMWLWEIHYKITQNWVQNYQVQHFCAVWLCLRFKKLINPSKKELNLSWSTELHNFMSRYSWHLGGRDQGKSVWHKNNMYWFT